MDYHGSDDYGEHVAVSCDQLGTCRSLGTGSHSRSPICEPAGHQNGGQAHGGDAGGCLDTSQLGLQRLASDQRPPPPLTPPPPLPPLLCAAAPFTLCNSPKLPALTNAGGHDGQGGGSAVFISNLQWWTTDAEVEAACAPYGRVTSIRFIDDKACGKSRGMAIVEFAEPGAAAMCITGLNGCVCWGAEGCCREIMRGLE